MIKRCKFFVALMVCVCVFSCGIVGTASAESVTFTTSNCSQTLLKALNAAANGTASTDDLTIDIGNVTLLQISTVSGFAVTMKDGTESPFPKANDEGTKTVRENAVADIDDLKGIELFTAISMLNLTGMNKITEINFTGTLPAALTKINIVDCGALTKINLPGNTHLQEIYLAGDDIVNTLNVGGCTSLTIIGGYGQTATKDTFDLRSAAQLKNADVSYTGSSVTKLVVPDSIQTLNASGMTGLTTIKHGNSNYDNLSDCTALTTLDITGCTSLTALDVTNCTALTELKYHCATKITGYSPIVYAKQLILDGSLNMAFYVPMSATELNGNTGKTVKFTVGKSAAIDGTFRSDLCLTGYIEDGVFVEGTKEGSAEVKLYAFVGGVTSIQMADAITADITVGAKAVTFEGYTVKKYLGSLTADASQTEATKNLANSVGAYGYYAQITLKETNTSYGTHTSMDEPATGYTVTAETTAQETYSTYAMKIYDGDTSTVTTTPSVTYTLDLDSKTTLHVYLPSGSSLRDKGEYKGIDAISTSNKTYEINSTNVTAKETKIDETTTYFDIAFSDIAAHELAEIFTIPVTIGNNPYTIEVSAMSYVNSVISKSNEDLNTSAKLGDSSPYPKATHLKQAVLALDQYREKTDTYRSNPNE